MISKANLKLKVLKLLLNNQESFKKNEDKKSSGECIRHDGFFLCKIDFCLFIKSKPFLISVTSILCRMKANHSVTRLPTVEYCQMYCNNGIQVCRVEFKTKNTCKKLPLVVYYTLHYCGVLDFRLGKKPKNP